MIHIKNKHFSKIINRQTVSYAFFGLLTAGLNIVLYQTLMSQGFDYKIANIFTLIVVKIASYIVNKLFVFNSNARKLADITKEFIQFIISRIFTMLVDFFGVILFVEVFGLDPKLSKYFFIIAVVIINYFFGIKVFKSGEKNKS